MAVFKTESEPIWGSPENVRLCEALPKRPPLSAARRIQPRPPVAPLGATDALVAVDRHDRPAEPSSSLLERL